MHVGCIIYMSYVSHVSIFMNHLKITCFLFFKKFGIFLLVCKGELNLHYKNENIERKYF